MWRHSLYLFLVWVIICIIEGDRIITDPNLSQFNIFFEIISGYSGCGISIGYPNVNYDLAGVLNPFSRFLIATCIILGRHRGLPHSIDKSVQLPTGEDGHYAKQDRRETKKQREIEREPSSPSDEDRL